MTPRGHWPRALRPRLPRRTVRLRLTMHYGIMFLLSGAALLAITYVLVAYTFPVVTTARQPAAVAIQNGTGCLATPYSAPAPGTLPHCLQQQRAAELRQLLTESGVALGIMAVASIGLGWLIAGRVLRPLRTITAAARHLSASNLHQRLALSGPDDELKELGDTFDGLLARLETAFAAQRQFVANASHELRTPLARQRTLVEVALASPRPSTAELRSTCWRVLAAGEQQERLIEALLTLARGQRGLDQRAPLDLAEITSDVTTSREPEALRRGLRLRTTASAAPLLGDLRLVERLAANLVDNALRHNVAGGWAEVTASTQAGHAILSVANTGPPIPQPEIPRLFQPFQRLGTARTGGGTSPGLGLSIVDAIARAHGARIRARPLTGGGLAVQVRFPALAQHPAWAQRLPPVPLSDESPRTAPAQAAASLPAGS
jgi:signal transduction histidine kinase